MQLHQVIQQLHPPHFSDCNSTLSIEARLKGYKTYISSDEMRAERAGGDALRQRRARQLPYAHSRFSPSRIHDNFPNSSGMRSGLTSLSSDKRP